MLRFLLFELGESLFGLPGEYVHKITDARFLARLPFVAQFVEGLLATDGGLALQIDLKQRLYGTQRGNGRQIIEVCLAGHLFALRVDRVLRFATLREDQIHELSQDENQHCLTGQAVFGGQPLLLLNPELVVEDLGIAPPQVEQQEVSVSTGLSRLEAEVLGATFPVLLCQIGQGVYAFPLDQLAGVCQFEDLTPLPGAPKSVAGVVTTLRDSVLWQSDFMVCVRLEKILREPDMLGAQRAVIIDTLLGNLAARVDAFVGIVEYSLKTLQTAADQNSFILGMIPFAGQRMAGLVDVPALSQNAEFIGALAFSEDVTTPASSEEVPRAPFLLLACGARGLALPLDWVEQVYLEEPCQPLPILAPPWLPGVVSVDGRAIPVIDLRRLVGEDIPVENAGTFVRVTYQRQLWLLLVSHADRIVEIAQNEIDEVRNHEHGLYSAIARTQNSHVGLLSPRIFARAVKYLHKENANELLSPTSDDPQDDGEEISP